MGRRARSGEPELPERDLPRLVARTGSRADSRRRAYRGAGVAGEIGHTVIQSDGPRCASCGNCGCLEVLTRWPALARDIPTAHDPASAIRLAQAGDPAARQAFEAAADHVARALGPLISVLNPDMVLIGGTVGQRGFQVVRTPLLRALKRYTSRFRRYRTWKSPPPH